MKIQSDGRRFAPAEIQSDGDSMSRYARVRGGIGSVMGSGLRDRLRERESGAQGKRKRGESRGGRGEEKGGVEMGWGAAKVGRWGEGERGGGGEANIRGPLP